jgi:hypothetical protein
VQIIALSLAGVSLLGQFLVPLIAARKTSGQPSGPLPLPPGSVIPPGASMTPAALPGTPATPQHHLLDEAGKLFQVVLSQQGSAGLQGILAGVLKELAGGVRLPGLAPAATAAPTGLTVADLLKIFASASPAK